MSFLLFYIPCNNYKEADKIAKILVKEKLAACVNIINNVNSYYLEADNLNITQEILLIAKTSKTKKNLLTKKIEELHSYKIPALIQLEAKANASFTNWLLNI